MYRHSPNGKKSRGKELTVFSDSFSKKKFVLKSSSEIFQGQSFEEPFFFSGFIFTVCLKGEATIRQNHREYTLKANSIHFYTPGQIFTLVERTDDLSLESLFLSADYIFKLPLPKDFELLKQIRLDPVRTVSEQAIRDVIGLRTLVAKSHLEESNFFHERRTEAFIYALLMEIGAHFSVSVPSAVNDKSRQEALVDEFFKLLFESFRKERQVTFYANKLCLTPKYLSMTIKEVTGHPASRWINEMVILEAKRLLKATKLTALQISEELNFPNPSFFGRFFKQHTDMTPLQFRKS
ncbi:MAG TPA: AraC family transcriptional regulator [Bacteroidales bacterium]|jgi:AraC family transcriptional activator of pobA|nr:AraC family transcriptional regulator [Bacteroidales bacterium]